jgi:hypothetical protein
MENLSQFVGKYVNRYLYTDVQPVGKIVAVKGKTTLVVKLVRAGENKAKMEFLTGGFSAICLNPWAQYYDFTELDETIEIRYSKSFNKQYRIENDPVNFYDYNF